MGKPKNRRKEKVFQATPFGGPDLAQQAGWVPLSDSLEHAGVSKRTFEAWREARLVPPALKPATWRRPKGRGGFIVLWPPELPAFLADTRQMSRTLHLRGQAHEPVSGTPSRSYAPLRIGLWVRGWEYDSTVIRETFEAAIDQFSRLLQRRFSLSELARWLYASSKVYEPTGARDNPKLKRPRRAWDVESVQRFVGFVHDIHPWIPTITSDRQNAIDGFWQGRRRLSASVLRSLLRNLKDVDLDRLRVGWRSILDAVLFQSALDPLPADVSDEGSAYHGRYGSAVGSDWIWQAFKGLDKDAYHVTTSDDVERWSSEWNKIKDSIPAEERTNITLVRGGAWDITTGKRIAVLERTYEPANFMESITKILKYQAVFMLLISGHRGQDVITDGAAKQLYEPTKDLVCPHCRVPLEPEPGWPSLWERLRKPRPIEHQRCPKCLAVWAIPEDPNGRRVFELRDEKHVGA